MSFLNPIPAWELEGEDEEGARMDARILPLVRAIAHSGSLAAAARACAVPYRTAWGVLEAAERTLGSPLVTLERGRGATPTPVALRWLAADAEATKVLD